MCLRLGRKLVLESFAATLGVMQKGQAASERMTDRHASRHVLLGYFWPTIISQVGTE